MRIAISSRRPDPDSPLEPHFGHARWFLIYDTEFAAWNAVENTPPAGGRGAGMAAAGRVRELAVQVVVTGRMGPHPRAVLDAAGIAVLRAVEGTVREALDAYRRGELEELKASPEDRCRHWEKSGGHGRSGARDAQK